MKFHGERGEHFFRSTLVQTLFYGIFSAWVLWSRQGGAGRFEWRQAGWTLRVPAIRALFHQIADPDRLKRLDLVEPLEWAADALNRVSGEAFFRRFREDQAVQYSYEPFLQGFDPELRKELGVWYTPPEVVKYMVRRAVEAPAAEAPATIDWCPWNSERESPLLPALADPGPRANIERHWCAAVTSDELVDGEPFRSERVD